MEKSKSVHQLERQIEKLTQIKQMPVLIEESRKFLTHFICLLQGGCTNDEYYFQTLYLCEMAILRCDVAERSKDVIGKILNIILEMIHREYVCKKVVVESLATVRQIMSNLYHSEVVPAHEMLQKKIPYLSKFFCEKEHFGIMCSIVGIIYQYVCKYDINERQKIFDEIMQDFNDPTNQLSDILQWQPESFYAQCRKYLNGIPDRQYYSLAARSAVFGEKTIIPLKDMPYISFEWNIHPREISFKALFDQQLDNQLQASIDFNDIRSLEIIEDLQQPRVVCKYGKITIEGINLETYDLYINVVDNNELRELAEFVAPLLNSTAVVRKNISPALQNVCDETIVLHEKLYNTMDFTRHSFMKENNDPKPKTPVQKAPKPKPDSQSQMVFCEKENDNDNQDNTANLSGSSMSNFQPFDTNWKTNLLERSLKSKNNALPLVNDPYDIEHMREEEVNQRKEKLRMERVSKRGGNGMKSAAAQCVEKRPQYMQSSTPSKVRRTTLSKSIINDNNELSSFGGVSSVESMDSDGSDETYTPYRMLSRTRFGGRGKDKKTTQHQSATARVESPKKSNVKKMGINTPKPGTGKVTRPNNRKTQISAISSSTPHVETTMQVAVPMNNAHCQTVAPCSLLSSGQNGSAGGIKTGSELQSAPRNFSLRKRLNSKHTTTTQTTTTKTTTTKTTKVGLATCTGTGPTEDTTIQEDTITMPPSETVPSHATEQVHCRALYTVEQRKEYRVHRMVNEADSFAHVLSEEDRRQALAFARKIVDILSNGINSTNQP